MSFLRKRSHLPTVQQAPEVPNAPSETVLPQPRWSAAAREEVEHRHASEQTPDPRKDGEVETRPLPAAAASTAVYPAPMGDRSEDGIVSAVEVSPATAEAVEAQRASEAEQDRDDREDPAEATNYRPSAPGADSVPLGVHDDRTSE